MEMWVGKARLIVHLKFFFWHTNNQVNILNGEEHKFVFPKEAMFPSEG